MNTEAAVGSSDEACRYHWTSDVSNPPLMSPLLSDPINSTFSVRRHTKSISEPQRRGEDFKNRQSVAGIETHLLSSDTEIDFSTLPTVRLRMPHILGFIGAPGTRRHQERACAALCGLRASNGCTNPPASAAPSCHLSWRKSAKCVARCCVGVGHSPLFSFVFLN